MCFLVEAGQKLISQINTKEIRYVERGKFNWGLCEAKYQADGQSHVSQRHYGSSHGDTSRSMLKVKVYRL